MSLRLDKALAETGTKFRIFPQPKFLGFPTEQVTVSVPRGQVGPGPSDDRMFVIDAINKQPYDETSPPYRGPSNAPVPPGPDGHFLHLEVDSREFRCATMYATVRRVLDVWEDYFGHRIEWQFEADFARLEMIPLIEWDNAQSGYGFIEFGFGRTPEGTIDHALPYCENFDVLAHELGHSIIFSQVGIPQSPLDQGIDYGGFQESCGDLVAIVSVMHFNSIVDHLLENTHGNLFTVNELDRVGELSQSRQIRVAFNSVRMIDVGDEPHDRSLPLTGGIFDIMVEVFQKRLVQRELISEDLARRSEHGFSPPSDLPGIQQEFDAAYEGKADAFKEEFLVARDYLGHLLARAWSKLNPPDFLTYNRVFRALLNADRDMGSVNQQTIRSCFSWRGIKLPRGSLLRQTRMLRELEKVRGPSHAPSEATLARMKTERRSHGKRA
jgi:hypothetical protein